MRNAVLDPIPLSMNFHEIHEILSFLFHVIHVFTCLRVAWRDVMKKTHIKLEEKNIKPIKPNKYYFMYSLIENISSIFFL